MLETKELFLRITGEDQFDEQLILENPQMELVEYVEQLLEERGVIRADLIRALDVDRVYGYQLLNGIRRMNRTQLLKSALFLELDLEEADRLLRLGEKGKLYARNREDAKVIFAIGKGMKYRKACSFIWGE